MNKDSTLKMQMHLIAGMCLFSALLAGCATQVPHESAPAVSATADPNFYIFLAFGQSNMEGYPGTIEEQDKDVDSRFQMMAAVAFPGMNRVKGNWYPAVPPLCRPGFGLGPCDYFGRTLVAHLPSNIKVGVINVAVSGCRIEIFQKGGGEAYVAKQQSWMRNIARNYENEPYGRLVEMAKKAQRDGVIKGILLHQGESNMGDKRWPLKVKATYDNLLKDLQLKPNSVPLLAGEFVAGPGPTPGLPRVVPNSYVISSRGCESLADHLHFNSAGYRLLGTRYGEKMLELLGYKVAEP